MKTTSFTVMPLLPGETPLPKAPAVVLDDGTNCIPQHYLSYQHTKTSVENIVAEIDCDPKYVLFVDEDNASIFIQVGIIGKDNYKKAQSQKDEKIVYGRRWRVEAQLPSSEIIQTAFLALMKAREHEVRELFKYRTNQIKALGNITTPFSCHHDLPLIAMSKATNTTQVSPQLSPNQIQEVFSRICYDEADLSFESEMSLNGRHLISFKITPSINTALPEILNIDKSMLIIVDSLTEDALMYAVVDELLSLSNRFVEENFTFKGFARFSRQQSIQKISELSAKTRVTEQSALDVDFTSAFANANYETDSTRVPRLSTGKLGDKIKAQLTKFDIKYGILPKTE